MVLKVSPLNDLKQELRKFTTLPLRDCMTATTGYILQKNINVNTNLHLTDLNFLQFTFLYP